MMYTFDNANAKEQHNVQYFEMFGNRAIYKDGWFARTIHRVPWEQKPRRPLTEDIWELYDTSKDFSLVNDLSAKNPEKLAEMKKLFLSEAENGAHGAIIVQGGRFGGWSLYVNDGVPAYTYNFLGLKRTTVASSKALKPGKATIRFEFAYDGGGLAKGGNGTLFVNDKKVAEGRIESTQPMVFSADETADVGIDLATPVVEAIGSEAKSRFTGKINKVTVAAK
ncbi:hypothetical protein [Alkalimarinus alittae]|uniref:Arylsulfatase n=1 Tax=Alkalimarinus alittae TaxID=2961619 RepID=A0ABY6N2Y4_9ALTE|nr:hypothetical protein [Alkalimarinus alittae]UZE96362.1 hypothetical protein NKI27_01045 [Alkalimarinus alittae]